MSLSVTSAIDAWKYPVRKQSLIVVYTLGLGIGIEVDLKEDNPRDEIAPYLRDSCAVNY